ncbi:hypothetical protein Tco_0935452 [Tanacetum coccineum]
MREVSSSSLFMGFSFKELAHAKSGATIDTSMSYQFVLSLLMDKNAIKLLLKEQSDGFQAQFAALHAELQETKGLVQARHGGGGDQGSLLPRSMRLDVPKFNGADPESWIFAINEYFTLLATPDE